MSLSIARLLISDRISPISPVAGALTIALGAVAVIAAAGTQLTFGSFPNLMPLALAVLVLDAMSRFAPQSFIIRAMPTILYGVLYLTTTCLFGILALYAIERFAFPLQDQAMVRADEALGVDWFRWAHWVDNRPIIQAIFYHSYGTMSAQMVLPVVVFGLQSRLTELRVYLLAFTFALIVTTIIAMLFPTASPIAVIDQTDFHLLRFTGATPVDHLWRLRAPGPMHFSDQSFGGIVSFPSFHATIAILIPLTLRRDRWFFYPLLFLDAAMLCSAVTEGAHYVIDIIAGSGIAVLAHIFAKVSCCRFSGHELKLTQPSPRTQSG
jgi:hypothetical protein